MVQERERNKLILASVMLLLYESSPRIVLAGDRVFSSRESRYSVVTAVLLVRRWIRDCHSSIGVWGRWKSPRKPSRDHQFAALFFVIVSVICSKKICPEISTLPPSRCHQGSFRGNRTVRVPRVATGFPAPETALLGTNWHHWRLSPTRGPRAEHDGFFRGMTASKRRHLLVLLHSFAPQEQQLDQGLRAICAEGQDNHIPFCRLCLQTSVTS